jgi:hypothetical protein
MSRQSRRRAASDCPRLQGAYPDCRDKNEAPPDLHRSAGIGRFQRLSAAYRPISAGWESGMPCLAGATRTHVFTAEDLDFITKACAVIAGALRTTRRAERFATSRPGKRASRASRIRDLPTDGEDHSAAAAAGGRELRMPAYSRGKCRGPGLVFRRRSRALAGLVVGTRSCFLPPARQAVEWPPYAWQAVWEPRGQLQGRPSGRASTMPEADGRTSAETL